MIETKTKKNRKSCNHRCNGFLHLLVSMCVFSCGISISMWAGEARRGDPPHGRRRWSPSARLHPEPPGSTGSENVVLRGPPHRYRPVGRRLAGARPRLQQVLFLVLSVAKTMDINGSNPLPLYSFTLQERVAHFLSIVVADLQLPLASSQLLVLSNAGLCKSRTTELQEPPTRTVTKLAKTKKQKKLQQCEMVSTEHVDE
jgi:hypothetical protein